MKLKHTVVLITGILCIAAKSWAANGVATLHGTKEDSEIHGTLTLQDSPQGLKVTGTIENVPMGDHGFHIHEFGDCGDEGKNAGGHFNPDQKPHGNAPHHGANKSHPGDMGNVTANEQGTVTINVTLPTATLTQGKHAVAGRAVILHENKDDFSQPTGNAGGRIGCGAIVLTK